MDENEIPVDLSNTTAKFRVKKSPLANDVLMDFSISGMTLNYFGLSGATLTEISIFSPAMTGGITLNRSYLGNSSETGGIFIIAPSDIMQNTPVGNWIYSLNIKIAGNDENLVQGKFSVEWNANQ